MRGGVKFYISGGVKFYIMGSLKFYVSSCVVLILLKLYNTK